MEKAAQSKQGIFSIHTNFRSLFTAPPNHLHPLDAWRALAMFWIIAQHTVLLFAMNADVPTLRLLSDIRELRPFYHAHFAVDIFFVLSGFLIGAIIIREMDKTGKLNWKRFYLRRALRMLPIYY